MGRIQTIDIDGIRAVDLALLIKVRESCFVNLVHISIVILIINIIKGKQCVG